MAHPSIKERTLRSPAGTRRASWILSLAAVALYSPSALAEELGRRWEVVVGAERLFGFYGMDIEQEQPNGDTESWEPSSFGIGYQEPIGLFSIPRIGVDVFIIDQLSLGGSLGFYSIDPDDDDDESDELDGMLFAPRVGYAIPFNSQWGFWPRGGFTYASRDGGGNLNVLALTLEGEFYFTPVPNVGFTGGPIFDLGLSGEWDPGPVELDYEESLFGLAFGMFVRF